VAPTRDPESAGWLSEQLVRLVQVVFAFVLAEGLGRYSEVVLRPWQGGNRLTALALLGVYVATIMSWIDWHGTVARYPYDFGERQGVRLADRLRFGADLFVVSVYAFTVFAVGEIEGAGASTYVFGYVAMFAGYVASGWLRRRTYGRTASNLRPIVIFGGVILGVWVVFLVFEANDWLGRRARAWAGVIVALVVTGVFRWVHTRERVRWRRRHGDPPVGA
jgi:hypothetical protein